MAKKAGGGGGKGKKASAKGGKKVSAKGKKLAGKGGKKQQHASEPQQQPQQQNKPRNSNGNNSKKLSSSNKTKTSAGGLSNLQEEMRKRLDGGKFRMLNEQLYTTTGAKAFSTFQSEPELFDVVRCVTLRSLWFIRLLVDLCSVMTHSFAFCVL